jgi:hypothetical protein
MLGGLGTLLYGIWRPDLTRAIGGGTLAVISLCVICTVLIRRWIVDTSEERRVLATAQRQASEERTRYIASQAALENERVRQQRDMAAERRRLAATLKTERKALAVEFEEQRATLISETMEATVLMMRGGKLTPPREANANLIRFPERLPHQAPAGERARSREHGVVGP